MPGKKSSGSSAAFRQIHAFRLKRHFLLERGGSNLTAVSGGVCGIQAQVMAAAEMALWARMRELAREEIPAALWEKRTLVKTSLMRQTLHLIPAQDFSLYIAALKRSRLEAVLRVMARFRITRGEADGLTEMIVEALSGGPKAQSELRNHIRPRVSKRVRAWMDRVSNVLRTALAEGMICYGGERGAEGTCVRINQWLPEQRSYEEHDAKLILLRRFLRAYGPATLADFSKWSGMTVKEAKPVWESLAEELKPVSSEGQTSFLLCKDQKDFAESELRGPVVRLLPSFDPFLLAHADKDHLVDAAHYKRVYRNQWLISPVVLLNGRVAGIWSHKRRADRIALDVQFFEKPAKVLRTALEEEAASLGRFLGAPCRIYC